MLFSDREKCVMKTRKFQLFVTVKWKYQEIATCLLHGKMGGKGNRFPPLFHRNLGKEFPTATYRAHRLNLVSCVRHYLWDSRLLKNGYVNKNTRPVRTYIVQIRGSTLICLCEV